GGVKHDFTSLYPLQLSNSSPLIQQKIIALDISQFQQLFRSRGKLTRLYLDLDSNRKSEIIKIIEQILPSGVKITEKDDTARYADKTVEAFRVNLNFLTSISLFVALLLVYNVASYSTLQRRRELAILKTLGVKQNATIKLLLVEYCALGALSALIGIGF